MYDELVKRLRNPWGFNGLIFELTNLAADVIEELNRRIDRAIELYNRNVEKSAMYEALAGISPEPPKEES